MHVQAEEPIQTATHTKSPSLSIQPFVYMNVNEAEFLLVHKDDLR